MEDFIQICEVGLRDGLQNEETILPTAEKLWLLARLVDAGMHYIEAASFVRPSAVPQMADSDEVMSAAVSHYPDRRFMGLIFNDRGYDRAIASGCRTVAIAMSVSETFCQHNNRMTLQRSLAVCRHLLDRARQDGLRARVYLSAAWVCPFEGPTPPDKTIAFAETIWDMGVDELSVADTIGHAGPLAVGRLMQELGRRLDMTRLAVHLHDTQAIGMVNAAAAIHAGVRIIDSSVGGLGGCPFAPGAAGNLASEDLVFLAYKMGLGTGVDLDKLMTLVAELAIKIGRPIGGRIRAWWESNPDLADLARRFG